MARILFTYRYSVAQYAGFFNKKEPPWRSHNKCSPLRCIAYNVDEASYKPRHDVLGCNCSYVKPPLQEVTPRLKQGNIPVIFIDEKDHSSAKILTQGRVKLGVTSSSDTETLSGYVAFSHVWSDGMGSNTEDGLPTCLVASLFERAHALGISYIWIDSLCVPKETEARIQAIILMNATYKYSAATVVLDSHIRQKSFDAQSTPLEVILLTLVTSPWMQRLWTLPEAVLPSRLVFQFKNTLATAKDIYDAIIYQSQRDFNTVIQSLSIEVFRIIKRTDILVPEFGRGIDLADMLHMLRLRSTSRASDEVVAIADLLDLDVRPLLTVKGDVEKQRKLFFQSLGSIPRDIVFTSEPRMTSHGFRWAPLSFLASDRAPDIRDACATAGRVGLSRCLGDGGLCGHYQVARLSRTASLTTATSVTIRYRDSLKKVVLANRVSGVMEFNAIATLPNMGTVQSLKIAVGLMHRGDSSAGISKYDYSGRLLIGEHDIWPSSIDNCVDMCTPLDEVALRLLYFEDILIVIVD